MELKDLLVALLTEKFDKDLKEATFAFHNAMVGKSKFFPKAKDVRTSCGSCIQGVRVAIWKWYHFEFDNKFEELVFKEKFGIHKKPLYGIKKK